jgi:anti-sigma factor RsiW
MADLSCQEIVELVTAYLEGDLDDSVAQAFADHLAVCPGCQTYVDQFRITIEKLGEVPVDTLSDDAQSRLLQTFRELPR